MKIPVNTYTSVYRAYIHPEDLTEMSFDEFVQQMDECRSLQNNKTDGALYNCCSWIKDYQSPEPEKFNSSVSDHPREEYIRRCKENVDKIYCLLLDVDGTMTLGQTIQVWQDYEFYIYSTFGNSANKEKFRLIVPLKTPMTNQGFNSRHNIMCQTFNVDGVSFTISQAFYFPSYSKENQHLSFTYHNKVTNRYDAFQLKGNPPITIPKLNLPEPPNYTEDNPHPLSTPVYKTLLTGRNLRRNDAMPLAILCKSKGINYTQYEYIVNQIAGADSCLRTPEVNLPKLWSESYDAHMRDSTAGALMQRLGCDTWRFERKGKKKA